MNREWLRLLDFVNPRYSDSIEIIIAAAVIGIYSAMNPTCSSSESNNVLCRVNYYSVYSLGYISNSTNAWRSYQLANTSFTTTTSVAHAIGYVTATEENYTGTLTGALTDWTVSNCTYLAK